MSPELVFASVAISLALFFYTWGVFGERRDGTLSLKYVLLFWIGLACDTTGTLTALTENAVALKPELSAARTSIQNLQSDAKKLKELADSIDFYMELLTRYGETAK